MKQLDEVVATHRVRLQAAERRAGMQITASDPNRAFENYLRFGDEITEAEREERAQSVATDSAGGYLVAQEFSDRLYSMLKVVDPLFDPDVVTVVETTGGPFVIPLLNDVAGTSAIVAENAISTIADLGAF